MADHELVRMPPHLTLYQGDTLPTFSAAIETGQGDPVDLTAATAAFLQLSHPDGTLDEYEATIVSGASGVVTFDWTPEITEALAPGRHRISVRVAFDDGDQLVAPSDRRARLTVRPALSPPT